MKWIARISTFLVFQILFLGILLAFLGRFPNRELSLVWQALITGDSPAERLDQRSSVAKKAAEQEPSYEELLKQRTLESRIIEARIRELESLRGAVASEQEAVTAKSKQLQRLRADLEKGLAEKDAAAVQAGREKRLGLLQSMPPKLAKSYLLEQGAKDENEVVEIIRQMDDVVAAKIFKEFKLPQEVKSLNGWLDKLGQGEPDSSEIQKLKEKVPPRT
ncbi:MAG: hypothetical protein U1D30_23745 [Planctomycetota bacterium]